MKDAWDECGFGARGVDRLSPTVKGHPIVPVDLHFPNGERTGIHSTGVLAARNHPVGFLISGNLIRIFWH